MESLTNSKIAEIMTLQADDGAQRLSEHFHWSEFSDQRQRFHQEFVYGAACFAADRGFTWTNVIRIAVITKEIFPQLQDIDVIQLASLLKHILFEEMPDLTPVQRHQLARYLTDTLVIRRRLFQAVMGGATRVSVNQLHSEVQLPPTVCPLAQGYTEEEWETLQKQAEIASALQLKEEELRTLREGPRVSLRSSSTCEEKQQDQETLDVVHSVVKAAEGQTLDTLNQEVTLLADIQQLRLQYDSLTTRESQSTIPQLDTTGQLKQQRKKAKSGIRDTGKSAGQ